MGTTAEHTFNAGFTSLVQPLLLHAKPKNGRTRLMFRVLSWPSSKTAVPMLVRLLEFSMRKWPMETLLALFT